ncbi:hypothetical protein HHU12_33710, partial [Flammeovirga aprica JL-4]|nr:hypothetical protein [Flammeovirga aprica JL-4]
MIDDANKEITKRIPGIQNRETLVSHLVDDYLEYLSSDKQLIVTVNEEESRKKLKSSLAQNVQEWQSQLKAFITPNKGLTVKSYQDYQVSSFERGEHEYILNGDLLPEDAEYKKSDFIDAFNDQLHFLAEHSGAQLYVFPIRLDYLSLDETLEIDNIQEDGPPTLSVNPKDYLQSKLQEVIDAEGDNIALVLLPYTNIEDGKIVVENGHLNLRDYSKLYPSLLYTENDNYFENIDLYFSGELSNATEYQELVLGALKGIKKPLITYAYAINSRFEVSKSVFGVDEEAVSGYSEMRKIILFKSSHLVDFAKSYPSLVYFDIGESHFSGYRRDKLASIFMKKEGFVINGDYPSGLEDGLSEPYVDKYIDALAKKSFEECEEVRSLRNYVNLDEKYIAPFEFYDEIVWPASFTGTEDIPSKALRNPKAFDAHLGNQVVEGLSYLGTGVAVMTNIPADEFVDVLAMGYYLSTGQTANFAYSSVAFATPYMSAPLVKKFARLSSSSTKRLSKSLGDDLDDWLIKELPEGVSLPQGKMISLQKNAGEYEALLVKKRPNNLLTYARQVVKLDFTETGVKELLKMGQTPERIKELAIAKGVVLALAILELGDKELE